jgi:hypothetical protein
MIFLSLSRQMRGQYLQLGDDHFLPHSLQFIIHYRPIIWGSTVLVVDSVIKNQQNKFIAVECYE